MNCSFLDVKQNPGVSRSQRFAIGAKESSGSTEMSFHVQMS